MENDPLREKLIKTLTFTFREPHEKKLRELKCKRNFINAILQQIVRNKPNIHPIELTQKFYNICKESNTYNNFHDLINYSITWMHTSEGVDYWRHLANTYDEIS